jgi:hypothetical protein
MELMPTVLSDRDTMCHDRPTACHSPTTALVFTKSPGRGLNSTNPTIPSATRRPITVRDEAALPFEGMVDEFIAVSQLNLGDGNPWSVRTHADQGPPLRLSQRCLGGAVMPRERHIGREFQKSSSCRIITKKQTVRTIKTIASIMIVPGGKTNGLHLARLPSRWLLRGV